VLIVPPYFPIKFIYRLRFTGAEYLVAICNTSRCPSLE